MGKVCPSPHGGGHSVLWRMQPFCQLEKELSGEERDCLSAAGLLGRPTPAGNRCGFCHSSRGLLPWLWYPAGLVAGGSSFRSGLLFQVAGLGPRSHGFSLSSLLKISLVLNTGNDLWNHIETLRERLRSQELN